MSTFEFGVGLFPTEPLQKMIHLAKLSEELGFSHVWVGDSHLIWREAYVNMAAVALNTSKVKIGTGVTNPLTRHPSVVASAYATLEEYSPGRMIVGIGLGDSSVETMGMKPAKLSYFEKTMQEMRDFSPAKKSSLRRARFTCCIRAKAKFPSISQPAGRRCWNFPVALLMALLCSSVWQMIILLTRERKSRREPKQRDVNLRTSIWSCGFPARYRTNRRLKMP